MSSRQVSVVSALLSLAVLFLAACGGGEAKESASDTAVPRFHAQYDRSDFNAIYNEATEGFRKSVSKPEFDKFMTAVRRKLGAVRSTKLQKWNVTMGTRGATVLLTYETEFEKGTGTETFTFHGMRGGQKLHGYNVSSNALIVN